MTIATPKRDRIEFDPYNNIQDAIENYNLAHANGLIPPQADELIFEYLHDQCSKDIVVFDIETSELIDDAVKISDMSVTVASAQLLRDPSILSSTNS